MSPYKILQMSSGEVSEPETFHPATQQPIRHGLFCQEIFGPIKLGECACGEKINSKTAKLCRQCGAPVEDPTVRRRRLGHITLNTPIVHVWFYKGSKSIIARLLDLRPKSCDKMINCMLYIVLDPGDSGLKLHDFIDHHQYYELRKQGASLRVGMGGEAVKEMLKKLDLPSLAQSLRENPSVRNNRRLEIVDSFLKSGVKPEWMVLDVLPVLPPDLRPILFMDDGTTAASDLNDLYVKVIRRNHSFRLMRSLDAPDIILQNARRLLQAAVDSLLDNGRNVTAVNRVTEQPLKSLSDMIRSKKGRFRGNLLGKRVDYSGRSQITVGPDLKLHQVGLPRKMAIELFKPFIISWLIEKGFAPSLRAAKKLVQEGKPEVLDALDHAVAEHPVILNRAPTLHKLGMQAFDPVLVDGMAIRLHPLSCSGFNADFDGDQMAVHVPLSYEAQIEARLLMCSVNNVFHPATGKTSMAPSQDMVLGIYLLTREQPGAKGEGALFADTHEAEAAYECGQLSEQARCRIRADGSIVETTIGRAILYNILPEGIPFSAVNKTHKKKDTANLIETVYEAAGIKATVAFLDNLKELGYRFATKNAISICADDLHVPSRKPEIIEKAKAEVAAARKEFEDGLATEAQRYTKTIDIWTKVSDEVLAETMKELKECGASMDDHFPEHKAMKGTNSIFLMADSGARGNADQIRQASGMRGLMAKPSGDIIERPIIASLIEGLSYFEYLISAHGGRKSRVDGPLKTPLAGYFTRRLVCCARDIVITEDDCGTSSGIKLGALRSETALLVSLEDRIWGRYLSDHLLDPESGSILYEKGTFIDKKTAKAVVAAGVDYVPVRSPLTCESERGICVKCYGLNGGTREMATVGDAVGVIAAQSIGEPGTQLTLRSHHGGGAASTKAVKTNVQAKHAGIVRLQGLKTIQRPDGKLAVISKAGTVVIADAKTGRDKDRITLHYGDRLLVIEGQSVADGDEIADWLAYETPLIAPTAGTIQMKDIRPQTSKEVVDEESGLIYQVITGATDQYTPRLILTPASGGGAFTFILEPDTKLMVRDGQGVQAGATIAHVPKAGSGKSADISGGLARVIDLLEARKPKVPAVLAEIDGLVKYGKYENKRLALKLVGCNGEEREYLLPKGVAAVVYDGDEVKAGDILTDGAINPRELIEVAGVEAAWRYIIDGVQQVYRSQDVAISDQHFEVIVRAMTGFVRIEAAGSSGYVPDTVVSWQDFQSTLRKMKSNGGEPPSGIRAVFGIAQVPGLSSSFLNAASFQRTTSILADAAIAGKVDPIQTNAARIITGKRILAGTGVVR